MKQNDNTPSQPQQGERFSLFAVARRYRRWLPLILLVTVMGTLAGLVWVYRAPAKNDVRATLLITDTKKDTDLMSTSGMSSIFGSNVDLDNQVEKMKSHDLLKGIVKKYELNVANTYNKNFLKREQKFINDLPLHFVAPESICDTLIGTLIFKVKVDDNGLLSVKGRNVKKKVIFDENGLSLPATLKTPYGEFVIEKGVNFDAYVKDDGLPMKMTFLVSSYDYAAEDLSKQIMPTIPNKKADVIELSYICPDRDFGKALLSDFIERYNRMGIEVDVEKARKVNDYLENRIAEVHAAVAGKEAQAEAFARQHNMVNPEKDGAVDYTISAELKKEIILAQSEVEKLNLIKSLLEDSDDNYSLLPIPAENQQIAQLVEGYNGMVQRKMALEIDAKPSNKVLQGIVKQLDAYRDNILVSIGKAVENAKSVLNSVKRQKGGLDAGVQGITSTTREYYDLMRDHEITNAIYLLLIKEQERNFMKMNNTLPTGIVVSAPHVMKKAPGLSPAAMLILIFCFSFAIVPVVLFVKSFVDDRIAGADDVTDIARNADILGTLPAVGKKQLADGSVYTASDDYRSRVDDLRLATQFATRNAAHGPVVMLTAAKKGAGSTTTAISLASSYAAAGRRAVVVELNFHDRMLADVLGVNAANGLVNIIADNSTDPKAAIQPTSAGFDAIVAGTINSSPLAVLSAEQLPAIIERLRAAYDVVIIDGPAATNVKEAEIIAPQADIVVNIFRAASTTYAQVRAAEDRANGSPYVVVNAVRRPGILTLWK